MRTFGFSGEVAQAYESMIAPAQMWSAHSEEDDRASLMHDQLTFVTALSLCWWVDSGSFSLASASCTLRKSTQDEASNDE